MTSAPAAPGVTVYIDVFTQRYSPHPDGPAQIQYAAAPLSTLDSATLITSHQLR